MSVAIPKKGGVGMRFPYQAYAEMRKAETADLQRDAKKSAAAKKQVIEESAIEDDPDEVVETEETEDETEDDNLVD